MPRGAAPGNINGFVHGGAGTPEYDAWKAMHRRCRISTAHNFHLYGGRGITVCAAWTPFPQFLADVGKRPSPVHSLERIDNNRGYHPSNVRWATAKEQARNRRSTKQYTYQGETHCLVEWAEKLNLPLYLLQARLRYKWPIKDVLTRPLRPYSTRRD
jgi:hypothetical protein